MKWSNKNGTTNTGNTTHVFLYLTESKNGDNGRPEPLSNRLYRYDLENNKLVNPKLLMKLPLHQDYSQWYSRDRP